MFAEVFCCGDRNWDKEGERDPTCDELVEFDKENKASKPTTLLQKLGKSALCCSNDPPPARSGGLPVAPIAHGEVPRAPAAATASEKDTVLGRIQGPPLSGWRTPCLDGTFMNIKYVGDMDRFLDETGVSWGNRFLASSMNYGAGTQVLRVTHTGNDVIMKFEGGRDYIQQFTVGGGPQTTQGAGGTIQVTPMWEGSALRVHIRETNGADKCVRWTYYQGDDLIQESQTANGSKITVTYCRQRESSAAKDA